MVNDGESVDVELPFEVREGDDEGEDGEASNFVKLKVSLQEELELENGDIVKVLGVQVKMAVDEELTPIATLGFAFEARERKGGDLEPTEPEEPETSATRNDFVGVWEGAVEFEDEGETKTAAVTVDLSLSGDSLVGTMSSLVLDEEEPDTRNIAGTVTNGTLTFDILVSEEDRDDPNCANWDASATATLDASLTTMNINLFGTFCGEGGGDFEAFEFDLTKQIGALNTPNTG